MPFGLSCSWRRLSSVQRELPPSTIVSPSSSSWPSFSTVLSVGSPAGTMIHTVRGASSRPPRPSSDVALCLSDRILVEVEHDALVLRVALEAVHHVPAHLSEADEAQLHQTNPLTASGPSISTRTTGRPCERSVCTSPSACAFFRYSNE